MKTPKKKSAPRVATVRVRQLDHGRGLALPAYQTADAAGLDLVAALPENAPLRLSHGKWALVPTGLAIELPSGYEAQVRPRSGLAAKHGITVLNSPGTIDADYRGEIQVILINLGKRAFSITRGERIAQMVIAPVVQARMVEVSILSETARGAGGFGSTGSGKSAAQARTRSGPRANAAGRAATTHKKKPLPRKSATAKTKPAAKPKKKNSSAPRRRT